MNRFKFHKMIGVGLLILFGLNCFLFSCKGAITSPPYGTQYVFLPGETAKIKWEFDDYISSLIVRGWFFTSSDGSSRERLALIILNGNTSIETKLFELDIERPSTLVLKNVNQSYNGVYVFALTAATGTFISDVTVYIAKKPNVILGCPSYNEVNEGGDFTCECRDNDGNPPANVTWHKDSNKIGETKTKNNTLTVSNVNETNSGNYTCVARSHTGDEFVDNKTIVVQVCCKPNTKITFGPECGLPGRSCIITCESTGFPAPSHNISHNGTVVSTTKTYTIDVVKHSDAGVYKCVAKNTLGNDSASANLTVRAKPNVVLSCSSFNEVNEGDDFTCECRDNDGNPPSNVTWYKDGNKFGDTGKEEQTLTLSNVDETYTGNYTCVARNHPDDEFVDVKTIQVQVFFKPNTKITFGPNCDLLGGSCTVTCNFSGFPAPSHIISHNGAVVSTTKTYTIDTVTYSDAGIYKCVAKNVLGNDSNFANLIFKVKPRNTTINIEIKTDNDGVSVVTSITCNSDGFPKPNYNITHNGNVISFGKVNTISVMQPLSARGTFKCNAWNNFGSDSASKTFSGKVTCSKLDCDRCETVVVWHIVVTLLSGTIIGILFSYIVLCSHHRWCRNRKPERNSESQTDGVDTTYQEFDLTKMNTEDNYQSLRRNVATSASNDVTNDDEQSTYMQLSKTRDEENNYQSLT